MGLFSSTPKDEAVAALKSEFEALRNADGERLGRYRDYREENEASRDIADIADVRGDYGQDKRRNKGPLARHNIPLPFGQALTVKHTYRIAGRLPDVVVDRREESPQERYRSDTMEKMVWGIIRESRGETQFKSGAWHASQLGAACYEVYFNIEKQMPLFRALDPSGVLVVRGLDDPHGFQRFYRFWKAPASVVRSEYRGKLFKGEPIRLDDISVEEVTVVQCSDKEGTTRFALEDGVGLYDFQHRYGFVPYTVIPNLGPEERIFGWADYEFVRSLVEYLPRLFSREADVLRMVSGGAYKESGTGRSGPEINNILQKGGVLTTRKDSELEPIAAPAMPEFADGHRDMALALVKMLGFAPDSSWGDGNAGSGSDRGLQLQPTLELAALKQINWGSGLGRLFAMALRMVEVKQVSAAKYRGVVTRGARRSPFNLIVDPQATAPAQIENPTFDAQALDPGDELLDVPSTPKELFDGDHDVRFFWHNRIDPDDPAFVMAELNKFQQAAQSLETTLERLGFESPEEEMKRIEQESDRFPWLRAGQISLIKAQLDGAGQGDGGGAPVDQGTGLDSGLAAMLGKDGAAMDADGAAQGLNSDVGGQLYGGA